MCLLCDDEKAYAAYMNYLDAMEREGKAVESGEPGARQVADARRYLYLGPLGDAALAAIMARGGVDVQLSSGRWVLAKAVAGAGSGDWHNTALELPDGATGDAVRGASLLAGEVMVLDHSGRPRSISPPRDHQPTHLRQVRFAR